MPSKQQMEEDAEFLASSSAAAVHDLHKSNLLRLQLERLVEDCHLPLNLSGDSSVKWAQQAHDFVSYLQRQISELRIRRPVSQTGGEAPKNSSSQSRAVPSFSDRPVHVPNVDSAGASVIQLSSILGSTNTLMTTAGNAHVLPTIPLIVVLPNELFDAKDYLRHRYLDQRNAIVQQVADGLVASASKEKAKKSSTTSPAYQVYWELERGDMRLPVLMIVPNVGETKVEKPKKKKKKTDNANTGATRPPALNKLRFRIRITFEMESLEWMGNQLRLLPNRNNLQYRASDDGDSQSGTEKSKNKRATGSGKPFVTSNPTTPYVNYLLSRQVQRLFHPVPPESTAMPKNLILATTALQIWALKRGLWNCHDGIEDWTVILWYLLQSRQVNARMAISQIMAAVFKCLVETNWFISEDPSMQGENKKGKRRDVIIMPADGERSSSTKNMAELYRPEHPNDPPTLKEYYHMVYNRDCPVFLDSTLSHNYWGGVSRSYLSCLQRHARTGLQSLHQTQFDLLFPSLGSCRFDSQYDAYIKIPVSQVRLKASTAAEYGSYRSMQESVLSVLSRALGDRVTELRFLSTGNGPTTRKTAHSIDDSDQVRRLPHNGNNDPVWSRNWKQVQTPIAGNKGNDFVLGVKLNPDNCWRLVDRGPPMEDKAACKMFTDLWGGKAELRRFKDGAIVYAVVWEGGSDANHQFHNDDTNQGGIVERIISHILKRHVFKNAADDESMKFELRDLASLVDTVRTASSQEALLDGGNPSAAHRHVLKAFDALSDFLRKNSLPTEDVAGNPDVKVSRLGIPLTIDAVDPMSPALRYSMLYPPLPHPLLNGPPLQTATATGAVLTDPIEVLLRLGASSKWPNDLEAVAAAKTAILVQLSKGISALSRNGQSGFSSESTVVSSTYLDVAFQGYVFRLRLRTDHEIKLLLNQTPSSTAQDPAAVGSFEDSVIGECLSKLAHHSLAHAVFTKHPSSSTVARLAQKWLASHLLSDHISSEVVELMVCYIYSENSSALGVPGSLSTGFMRFLTLLAVFQWDSQPLIVDPQAELSLGERRKVTKAFEEKRPPSPAGSGSPAMVIAFPRNAKRLLTENEDEENKSHSASWVFLRKGAPEHVVLNRACALAERSREFLNSCTGDSWTAAFQETVTSFRSYGALLRVDPDLLVDKESSSTGSDLTVQVHKDKSESSYTRSMRSLHKGPRELRIKMYRNLIHDKRILLQWNPIDELLQTLRKTLGHVALFFHNKYCPDVVAVLWRPQPSSRPFSALQSQFARPVVVDCNWTSETLVHRNIHDVLRELRQYTSGVLVDVKVFDNWGEGSHESNNIEKRQSEKKRKVTVHDDGDNHGSTDSN